MVCCVRQSTRLHHTHQTATCTHHYKECTICHEILESYEHIFDETSSQDTSDVNKVKVDKDCSVCHYTTSDIRDATEIELCDFMNSELSSKSFFDVFEPKDYLLSRGYHLLNELSDEKSYGYCKDLNKIVIYTSSNTITYPSDAIGKSVFSYKEKEVSNIAQINSALSEINTGSANYTGIKFANDITLYRSMGTLEITTDKPVQINLNGHKLVAEDSFYSYCIKVNGANSIVAIKDGEIVTPLSSGYDMKYTSSCVAALKAKTVRVSNSTLTNNTERGYAYIDSPKISDTYKLKLNNNTINSPIVSVCIQNGVNELYKNTINGNVSINGGTTSIDECTINCEDVAFTVEDNPINNDYIRTICDTIFNDESGEMKAYIVSGPDAITILDRRSKDTLYTSPKVSVSNSTLYAFCKNNNVYGYGLRYVDLGFDTSKDPSREYIEVANNNTSPCCGTATKLEQIGGYTLDPII